jgi:hypothetical protein
MGFTFLWNYKNDDEQSTTAEFLFLLLFLGERYAHWLIDSFFILPPWAAKSAHGFFYVYLSKIS